MVNVCSNVYGFLETGHTSGEDHETLYGQFVASMRITNEHVLKVKASRITLGFPAKTVL